MSTLETQLTVDRFHYLRLGLILVLQLSTSFFCFFFLLELWEELSAAVWLSCSHYKRNDVSILKRQVLHICKHEGRCTSALRHYIVFISASFGMLNTK